MLVHCYLLVKSIICKLKKYPCEGPKKAQKGQLKSGTIHSFTITNTDPTLSGTTDNLSCQVTKQPVVQPDLILSLSQQLTHIPSFCSLFLAHTDISSVEYIHDHKKPQS